MTFATRLVAEVQGIRWASMLMAPCGFLSAHDPPVIGEAPYLTPLRSLGPGFHRPLFWLMRRVIRSWGEPWHRLRSELGLPPAGEPVLDGQHSPELVLAHFSALLGAPQPDWPPQVRLTGFPFYRPARGLAAAPRPGDVPERRTAPDRLHPGLLGGAGPRPFLRREHQRRDITGAACRPPRRQRRSWTFGGITARRRGRLRLRAVLGTVPPVCGGRSPGRDRYGRAGDACGTCRC